ncbi:hypothetical protein [Tropicimonas sp. IMCC6043]|uniref:hypothetical protein n=1 Tax=Tropicimonas sp. IMCC6043 TaxID=2510645 RepID=UPI00101CFF03|nr:hypothetical protein [Tropicimonas sp. IMCC6043]RYH11824.1 hypothetical protein EU800_04110 [Tropicimonas sp. IMCC6043]
MNRPSLAVACVLALAACAPEIPDSAAGVGFGSYDSYASERYARERAARNAQLTSSIPTAPPEETGAPSPRPIAGPPLSAIAAPTAPVVPAPAAPQAVSVQELAAAGIGSSVITPATPAPASSTPTAAVAQGNVPARPADTGPDIVAYALATSHPVGQPVYRRTMASQARADRRCEGYSSGDMAQLAFLEAGGPERDRHGIDPDGDGYACAWDPGLYRRAVGR